MKVIITKDCKDGKINDVIDVSNGYATNFLIKKGFALPYNDQNVNKLNKRLAEIKKHDELNHENANKVKAKIEGLVLKYSLKVVNDVVHGSITRKQIFKSLQTKDINLDIKMVKNVKIISLGKTIVEVKLLKDIIANLTVEVTKDGE